MNPTQQRLHVRRGFNAVYASLYWLHERAVERYEAVRLDALEESVLLPDYPTALQALRRCKLYTVEQWAERAGLDFPSCS